jgi:antitoxin (DNA-binding transcriptional repressor) of toxin-antitoxin stability system
VAAGNSPANACGDVEERRCTEENFAAGFCDAKMYHIKKASVRDLRCGFKQIERLLHQGEEIQITKRRRIIARLVPESTEAAKPILDFLARMRTIYGDKVLAVSGVELISSDGSRY